MDKKKRDRSANFSSSEVRLLVDLIIKHSSIIENKQTDCVTWQRKDEEWAKLTTTFNSRNGQCNRTTKMLKIKYEGIKRSLRKKEAHNKFERYKTGGGCPKITPLTDWEELLMPILKLSVTGLDTVEGDGDNVLPCQILENSQDSDKENAIENNSTKHYNFSGNEVVVPAQSKTQTSTTEIHIENDEIIEEINPNVEARTDKTKWTNLNKNQLTTPKHVRLLSKIKPKKHEINEKYSTLASARADLVKLQTDVAKKELQINEDQLLFGKLENDRKEKEHIIRMELLRMQIESFAPILES